MRDHLYNEVAKAYKNSVDSEDMKTIPEIAADLSLEFPSMEAPFILSLLYAIDAYVFITT